ncbi:hypothetical protein [Sabulibacter ruber]|uniref:hypothetical protein n=1 Tax=Sabulibacter ruber TaxID=2811901 RepID=UPI001A9569FF|nr:hypothetical protein [Sabulibacter ruber]
MKRFLVSCSFLVCFSACKQKTFAEKVTIWPGYNQVENLDSNNGFKNLKLNRHISAYKAYLVKSNTSESLPYAVYSVKPDSLTRFYMEDIKIKSIEAHFYKDLLLRIKIDLEGEKNSFPFYLQLIEAYGGAYPEENLQPETYVWNGNTVNLRYSVANNRNATADITSNILLKDMNK